MAESQSEHTPTNDRQPFDKFQETVRNLLQVPKRELDKERRKAETAGSQEDRDVPSKS